MKYSSLSSRPQGRYLEAETPETPTGARRGRGLCWKGRERGSGVLIEPSCLWDGYEAELPNYAKVLFSCLCWGVESYVSRELRGLEMGVGRCFQIFHQWTPLPQSVVLPGCFQC